MKTMNRMKKLAILSLAATLAVTTVFGPSYNALAGPATSARARFTTNVDRTILSCESEEGRSADDRFLVMRHTVYNLDAWAIDDAVERCIQDFAFTGVDQPTQGSARGAIALAMNTQQVTILAWNAPEPGGYPTDVYVWSVDVRPRPAALRARLGTEELLTAVGNPLTPQTGWVEPAHYTVTEGGILLTDDGMIVSPPTVQRVTP